MTAVTFLSAIGGDNSTVSDDSSPTTGLKNNGHRTRFIPALVQFVAVANFTVTAVSNSVTAAAASATSALTAPGTSGTSTTSLSVVASGTVSPTIQTGKAYSVGQRVALARTSAPTTAVMYGAISAYNSGTGVMSIVVDQAVGAGLGPFTDWTVSLSPYGITPARQVATTGLATGGGDLTADRTINVPAATSSDVRTGADTTKSVTSGALVGSAAFITLTDAATVAWDVNSGYNAQVTLGGNRTIGAPTNLKDGVVYTLNLIEDATGSRLPSFHSIWDFGVLIAPTLQTAAGKVDKVTAQYNSGRGKLEAAFWRGA